MEDNFAKLASSPVAKVVYFAVLLILVLMILWNIKFIASKGSEHLIGVGSAKTAQSLFSGPNIRRLGQDFSSTNQGDQTTVYLPDVKEIIPDVLGGSKERLTSAREPPVFYDIGSELEAYQSASSGAMKADVAAGMTGSDSGSEFFASGSPAAMYQEDILRQKLYQ